MSVRKRARRANLALSAVWCGGVAWLTFAIVLGLVDAMPEPPAEIAPASAPLSVVAPELLPPCAEEDSPGPCYWDASTRGNGQGRSFWNDADAVTHLIP